MAGLAGQIFLVLGAFGVLLAHGVLKTLAFVILWLVFGLMMMGVPNIVCMIRVINTFSVREFVHGLLAQLLLIGILAGVLYILNMKEAFGYFMWTGVVMGLLAPKHVLLEDRHDTIKSNISGEE